jgi:L-alanine-DL-glutamate epimerase-like enolase superfamily enzyme
VIDVEGRSGWGEAGITPGLTDETAEGGWAFVTALAPRLIGLDAAAAQEVLAAAMSGHEHAASTLMTSLEVLQGSSDLEQQEPAVLPLLAPLQAHEEAALAGEIEARLTEGWRTLKVKVGFDVVRDLARIRFIQAQTAGRAVLRLDANQAFSAEDGVRFATGLRPEGIELFEQPCSMHDWAANANVAARSAVPVMLDEIVHSRADIERAASCTGVGFVKLKLKKMGGVARVRHALERIRALGLEPVLGDGSGTDIGNWLEAQVARTTIRNAGEFNGFLKLRRPLLAEPLDARDGALHLRPGRQPAVDRAWLAEITEELAVAKGRGALVVRPAA